MIYYYKAIVVYDNTSKKYQITYPSFPELKISLSNRCGMLNIISKFLKKHVENIKNLPESDLDITSSNYSICIHRDK